jgi:tetratricopeptide (TPR) repeat protein
MKIVVYLVTVLFSLSLAGQQISQAKVKALYNSLDPQSIAEHLAFYELYSSFPEGKGALHDACNLLNGRTDPTVRNVPLPFMDIAIHALIALVNKPPDMDYLELNDVELNAIEKLAERLPNRRLKGHWARAEEEVIALSASEIDLSRGILLTQLGGDPQSLKKIRSYEAMIDLMALQILARLSPSSPPAEKIRAINHFIFDEMGFRFPPHSLYAKEIDLYTFLPSVLDSRRGVCLGVSILYLCLAQRLNLPLEMITPPGHIFVRYRQGDQVINIETTARGIHLDSDDYLGIETCSLQQRNIKDVIGLAHFNQASIFWQHQQYHQALSSYLKAKKYLPDDVLLQELMAYCYILTGEKEKGEQLLKEVADCPPTYTVVKETLAQDYLEGQTEIEGIEAMFMPVDETRRSIIQKRDTLEAILQKNPRFRAGLFSLAGAWLQLHRDKEALDILKRYHELDQSNPSVEYFLAIIYAERYDYDKAWEHLKWTEKIVQARQHDPQALSDLRKELAEKYPE